MFRSHSNPFFSLGRFPFVEMAGQTGIFENRIPLFFVSQICPVRSVNTLILYIVVVDFRENLVEKTHFTFNTTGLAGSF